MKYCNNSKGFTLIELLAVIVILAVIALISTPIIVGLINSVKKESFKASGYGIIDSAENGFARTLLNQDGAVFTEYQYTDGIETKVQGNIDLNYNGKKPNSGTVVINEQGKVAMALYENGYCATKSYNESEITLEETDEAGCMIPEDVPVLGIYDESQGVNRPQLANSMIPVMYYGGNWVKADITNQNAVYKWYGYTGAEKKWANAVTVNDSNRDTYLNASIGTIIPMVDINAMWVWIPRYVYKITGGWHTNSGGAIMLQFSKERDDNWNSSVIGNINTNTTANASNNTWTNHPAFTFGSDELTGFWVAKFWVSGIYDDGGTKNASNASMVPNQKAYDWDIYGSSYYALGSGAAFNISRTFETNARFGWGTTGDGIDTHLIKNVEWGAIAYLSQTSYGINGPIGSNNNSDYITGCGVAPTISIDYSSVCNAYDTATGMTASTTSNIYGIYDMSGISQHVAAAPIYSQNGGFAADSKYQDVYETTDNTFASDVYTLAINHKGDALYETSASSPFFSFPPTSTFTNSHSSWYGGDSEMPGGYRYSSFDRGNTISGDISTGIFSFRSNEGGGGGTGIFPFRPILIVGEGL